MVPSDLGLAAAPGELDLHGHIADQVLCARFGVRDLSFSFEQFLPLVVSLVDPNAKQVKNEGATAREALWRQECTAHIKIRSCCQLMQTVASYDRQLRDKSSSMEVFVAKVQ